MLIKPCLIANLALPWVAAWAIAASPSGQYGNWAEEALQQARGARFQKDYAQSLRLSMKVVIAQPQNQEARRLLTEAATELSRARAARIEVERLRVLKEIERGPQPLLERREREMTWGKTLQRLIDNQKYLEAYDFLYGLTEDHPAELWPTRKLLTLHSLVLYWGTAVRELSLRDRSYGKAVLGFSFFLRKEWAEAKKCWEEVLLQSPPDLPARPRIKRYLERVYVELSAFAPPPRILPAAEPAPAPVAIVEKKPQASNSETWYAEALELHQQGEFTDALALLEKLLQRRPKHESAAKLRYRILQQLAKQNRAKIEEYYLDGLMHYGQGRADEALMEFKKALALDPGDQRVRGALERVEKEFKGGTR